MGYVVTLVGKHDKYRIEQTEQREGGECRQETFLKEGFACRCLHSVPGNDTSYERNAKILKSDT